MSMFLSFRTFRLFSLSIFTLAVVTIFASCSGSDSESNLDSSAQDQSTSTSTTQSKAPSGKEYAPGDTLAFEGTLIDTHCYNLDQENIGDDHTLPKSGFREDCAAYCANLGYPVAVLIGGKPGNKVWILRFSSQVFADFMAETVRVEGTFISGSLIQPSKVEMKSEDGWVQII